MVEAADAAELVMTSGLAQAQTQLALPTLTTVTVTDSGRVRPEDHSFHLIGPPILYSPAA